MLSLTSFTLASFCFYEWHFHVTMLSNNIEAR
jgi:hypothetical protein